MMINPTISTTLMISDMNTEKKIEELQNEIADYREFVKSVDITLTPPKTEREKRLLRHELHNLRAMCDYLLNRYINNGP